jgi:alpha-L-rhamnosidase
MIFLVFIIIVVSFNTCCSGIDADGILPSELKCDYFENPLGIENDIPKLSWILNSPERNQKQTAYQIIVSGSLEKLKNDEGDIWNSHKVRSEQSIQIAYEGKKPESGKRYYWKVRVWDKRNNKSEWSVPAYWEMGLLEAHQWKAEWIGYESETAPLLRKEFEITQSLKEARVYICGLGYYELSINGSKIGDHVLDPGQTDYEQRTFYNVYDVTKDLKQGSNAIGVMLGDGWYNQTVVNHGKYGWNDVVYGTPRLIFQMHLTYSDGSEKLIISDKTWKGSSGPVVSNNLYAGEQYDARMEQVGWDAPGFDDTNWDYVKQMEGPGGKLVYQNIPPIKKMQTVNPIILTNPKPGVYVFDMGQNFAGWARLKLKADKGTEIRLRFAEWLDKDGMIDPGSTGYYATAVVQTDKYVCKGNGVETWEPRFTYHGFQYVEMTGFIGTPDKENLEGVVVHTSLQKAGEFDCSDDMFNRLHKTALWTEISNLHSIPTDCPHREKCGWLGDAFLTSDMTMYNFESASFWSKFIRDIETSRKGDVPVNIAPGRRVGGKDPDWGAAFIQLTWNIFLYYGDKSIISEHYEGMTYFMDQLQKQAKDYIIYEGIGSLFSPGRIMPQETPKEYTSTVLFYFCADVMTRMARNTGKMQDEEKYSSIAQRIKSSFNNKFYNTSVKTYGGQEKNTLALAFGLVPDSDEEAVAKNLYRDVVENHNFHVSTGIFGSRYIYWVLGNYGYGETVKKVLNSCTFPSYGYLFSCGATTFWENWGELKFEDRNVSGDSRSKNHPFQGGFDAWFFNGIAGINPDPENPGFKHIIFHPQLINSLEYANATYNSIHGLISSKWQHTADEFTWSLSVPVNTTATVYLPAVTQSLVYEGNIPVTESEGIEFLRIENGYILFEIGSGEYLFSVNSYN